MAEKEGQILSSEGGVVKGLLLVKPMGLKPGSKNLEQRRLALARVVDLGEWEGLHIRQDDINGECLALSWIPNDPNNLLAEIEIKVGMIQAAAVSYYGYSRTLKRRGGNRR